MEQMIYSNLFLIGAMIVAVLAGLCMGLFIRFRKAPKAAPEKTTDDEIEEALRGDVIGGGK
ncbi:unnamed protein product [marine sediment metagenome]|uniref:Uncharacterized protein n=1 Tax=marine sediment metagenome TaxID=412755 RepID=X1AII8_9ZZZZ